jgi:hypothetical protein
MFLNFEFFKIKCYNYFRKCPNLIQIKALSHTTYQL